MVLGRGFEPLILAVKGQCPRPLDEPCIKSCQATRFPGEPLD